MIAPYQKIENFLRRTPWVGSAELEKLAAKAAQFLAQIAKLKARQNARLFFTKKEQKK